jgi:hypothetical protein
MLIGKLTCRGAIWAHTAQRWHVFKGEFMVVVTQKLSCFPAEHFYVLQAGPHHDLSTYCLYLPEEELEVDTADGAETLRLMHLSMQMIESATHAERVAAAREFLLVRNDYGLPYFILAREGSVNASETEANYSRALALFHAESDRDLSERAAIIDPYFMEEGGHCLIATEVARFLWLQGKKEEALLKIRAAAGIFGDDYESKPVYTATSWLIQMDRDQTANLLINICQSSAAEWFYAKALLLFRSLGSTPVSRAALVSAMLENRLIGEMLLSALAGDDEVDEAHKHCDRADVQKFVDDTQAAWQHSSGSQEWLAESLGQNVDRFSGSEAIMAIAI